MPRGFADRRLCRLFVIGSPWPQRSSARNSASADQTLHALTSNGSALRVQLKLCGETVTTDQPLLISDGERSYDLGHTDRLGLLSDEFERAFLALRSDGALILGVSSSASLTFLQEALLAPEEEGGLAAQVAWCSPARPRRAWRLAGGLGYSFGTTSTPLPNALVVDGGRLERP